MGVYDWTQKTVGTFAIRVPAKPAPSARIQDKPATKRMIRVSITPARKSAS